MVLSSGRAALTDVATSVKATRRERSSINLSQATPELGSKAKASQPAPTEDAATLVGTAPKVEAEAGLKKRRMSAKSKEIQAVVWRGDAAAGSKDVLAQGYAYRLHRLAKAF